MDVGQRYKEAREAGKEWSQLTITERLIVLGRFREVVADRSEELAGLVQDATGKLRFEALTAEILQVVDTISYWQKHARRILNPKRISTPLMLFGRRSWIEYKPRGVVLVISPWNFPFQLSLIPALGALLAGNAVLLKPSEVTSQLDRVIEELFMQAGFPPGVVQVISGDGSVGAALVEGEPDFIFFTGSVSTGKAIQRAAAENLIPTILELGGKDAMILLDDAPLERAIQGALWGSFTNCGQVCLGTERILVHQSIYDAFLQGFVPKVQELVIGEMTSLEQSRSVRIHVRDALSKGARLLVGENPDTWSEDSLDIRPCVIVDVRDDMLVSHSETFGPVVTVTPFSSEEEAVNWTNNTSFGLGASVWSSELSRARDFATRLHVGNISINDTMITVANPHLPFGGVKASGIGSYHGEEGLRAFCHQTAVMVSSGKRNSELNWPPYTKEKEELIVELIRARYGSSRTWLQLARKALNRKVWSQNE